MLRRCSIFILILAAASLYSQSTKPGPSLPIATYHSNVNLVTLDVVVTSGKDDPVSGLHQKDFHVFEDGKPQTILSFEEHKNRPATQIKLPPMPPHIYSNYPTVEASDSVNVLLLDALNTPMQDQSYVHAQMIKYLNKIPPGTRMALFTLASRLRMVQGVTTDSSALLAVLKDLKSGAAPHQSPLRSQAETEANQRTVEFLRQNSGPPPENPQLDPVRIMQDFLADVDASHTASRAALTLQSLQDLARYLADIPGRKNLIWFSGSFPGGLFPDPDLLDPYNVVKDFQPEIKKTTDLLAAARIAIYPVGAEGLATELYYQANGEEIGGRRGTLATQDQIDQLRKDATDRDSSHGVMEELAKDTGGRAFYNVNNLGDALLHVVKSDEYFYTLTYTPANTNMNGAFRHIEVKLDTSRYKLAYRHGYYAQDIGSPQSGQPAASSDPLLPLMGLNLPEYSQILYKIRVLPDNPQPTPGVPHIGSNTELKGPFTRYTVDFAVAMQDLKLQLDSAGVRHGNVEVMMVAYAPDGKPLNMTVLRAELVLKPDAYRAFLAIGLQVKKQIDVPNGAAILRTGVFDPNSEQAGTLAVLLNDDTAQNSEGARK